jgi:hypothetical protein
VQVILGKVMPWYIRDRMKKRIGLEVAGGCCDACRVGTFNCDVPAEGVIWQPNCGPVFVLHCPDTDKDTIHLYARRGAGATVAASLVQVCHVVATALYRGRWEVQM